MRVVVDTNVLFSALYRPESEPGKLVLLALEEALELFAPVTVRDELERALRSKLGYSTDEWRQTLEALPIEWIEAAEYAAFLERAEGAIEDASDAPILATALLLNADVVSGDHAFHPLVKPIVKTWRPKGLAGASRARRRERRARRRARRRR